MIILTPPSVPAGGYVQTVTGTAPIVITGTATNPNVTITGGGTGACGVVQIATQAQVYARTPFSDLCALVVNPTFMLIGRDDPAKALYVVADGTALASPRGTDSLDFQSYRTTGAQGPLSLQCVCVGNENQSGALGGSYDFAAGTANSVNTAGGSAGVGRGNSVSTGIEVNAFGLSNTASGDRATILGHTNRGTAANGLAAGRTNFTPSVSSVAVGVLNNSLGATISANTGVISVEPIGQNTTGINSTTVGVNSNASGARGFSGGWSSSASTDSQGAGSWAFATAHTALAIGTLVNQTGGVVNSTTGVISGTPAAEAAGINSIGLGAYVDARAVGCTAIGFGATILSTSASKALAVGWFPIVEAANASAVGFATCVEATGVSASSFGSANNTTGVTISATTGAVSGSPAVATTGINSLACGQLNLVSALRANGVGYRNTASGTDSNAFGNACVASGTGSSALGFGATSRITNSTNIAGPIFTIKDNGESADDAYRLYAGTVVTFTTKEVDLKSVADQTITIPAGMSFWFDEVDLICTSISGMTVQPTIRAGITGTPAKYLAAVQTTLLTTAKLRERYTTLAADAGEGSIVVGVTVGATATTMLGRFQIKGRLIEDE